MHIESPSGRDIGTAPADHLRLGVGWLQSEGRRICAWDFNWAMSDAAMDEVFSGAPRAADLWSLLREPDAGYTYNGAVNMNAKPSLQWRLDRILRPPRHRNFR